jgi:hypothetical protein
MFAQAKRRPLTIFHVCGTKKQLLKTADSSDKVMLLQFAVLPHYTIATDKLIDKLIVVGGLKSNGKRKN